MSEAITPSRIESLATPILAALVVVTPLVHSDRLADPFALPKELAILAGALLVLLMAIVSGPLRRPDARALSPVFLLAALFVLAAALAILPAINRPTAARGWAQIAAGAVLAWGVARFARVPGGAALVLKSVVASAALVALAAVAQVFHPGLHLAPGGWSLLPAGTGATTLGSPGLTMQFLLLGLPAGVGAAALSRGVWRSLCGVSLGLMGAAILFAGRPEGWGVGLASLALLAGSAGLRVLARGGRWRDCVPAAGGAGLRTALVAAITLLAVLALSRSPLLTSAGVPPQPLSGVSLLTPTSGDPAVDRRAAMGGALPLVRRHPLGVGPGLWRHAFLEVAWSEDDDSPFTLNHQSIHAGNAFIETLAETGVAGGALFSLLLLAALLQSGHAARRRESPSGLVGFAAFNTLGTFAFASLFGSMMQAPAPALIFWIMVGLAQVALCGTGSIDLPRLLRPGERPSPAAPVSRLAAPVALIGWVMAVACIAIAGREALLASRHTLAGQAASGADDRAAALRILESPEVLRSPDHVPHFLAATAHLDEGQLEQAAARFGQVIDRSPFFIAAYLGRARAFEALGRYDRAEQDLDRALEVWPAHAATRLARAGLDAVRGRTVEALEGYRSVVRDDPAQPEPFFRMGELLAKVGRIEEAIQAYQTCIRKDPRFPAAHLRLADAFLEKGTLQLAVQYYEAAIRSAPADSEARLRLANAFYGMSRFCEARIALEGARDVELDPARRASVLELIDRVSPLCRKRERAKR